MSQVSENNRIYAKAEYIKKNTEEDKVISLPIFTICALSMRKYKRY